MTHPLPPEVIEALEAGRTIEAIKRLRDATGLSLKEAKDAVDAYAAGEPRPVAAAPRPAMADLPPAVEDALRQGNKIEAIRRLREHTGLGLKDARDRIDAAQAGDGSGLSGLAPGEVPRRSAAWWAAVVLAAGVLAYWLFG